MTDIPLYPLKFQPVYKDYVWGGDKISSYFKRKLPPGVYAESWEIADRPEGMSIVVNGQLAGRDLFGLMKTHGEKIVGRPCDEFPLLVKIIDARDKLSVQVHPDEAGAKNTGGDPKTEMWYVLAAEPGAQVYVGFKSGVNQAAFKEALARGKVEDLLRVVPVGKGDVVYLPGGRVHAIGAGCLILEVMQNSDTTFRLFDWNRLGKDGQPRALQINKALKAVRWDDSADARVADANRPMQFDREGNAAAELLNTPFFRFEKTIVAGTLQCAASGRTFHILFIEDGSVELASDSSKMQLESGMTVLVPAALRNYVLKSIRGPTTVLRIGLP